MSHLSITSIIDAFFRSYYDYLPLGNIPSHMFFFFCTLEFKNYAVIWYKLDDFRLLKFHFLIFVF